MSQVITIEAPDFKGLFESLQILSMPPAARRLWLARMGRMVIAQAKKNVDEQKTIDGSAMEPRKNSRLKTKMLKRLVMSKWLGVKVTSDVDAQVHFFRNAGIVAKQHQEGIGTEYTTLKYPRKLDESKVQTRLNKMSFTTPDGKPGCTANQAAMLIRLEYLPPHLRRLPGGLTADQKFVMENVSRKQAAFLIAQGSQKVQSVKKRTNLPARPFLGVNDKQVRMIGDTLMNDLHTAFKAKNYTHLLK